MHLPHTLARAQAPQAARWHVSPRFGLVAYHRLELLAWQCHWHKALQPAVLLC